MGFEVDRRRGFKAAWAMHGSVRGSVHGSVHGLVHGSVRRTPRDSSPAAPPSSPPPVLPAQAAAELAKALPGSRLRTLLLAGCKVDKKGCARIAAALPRSPTLTCLDLSSNHFAAGADELAWALPSIDPRGIE